MRYCINLRDVVDYISQLTCSSFLFRKIRGYQLLRFNKKKLKTDNTRGELANGNTSKFLYNPILTISPSKLGILER